jgi:hypothetical protein
LFKGKYSALGILRFLRLERVRGVSVFVVRGRRKGILYPIGEGERSFDFSGEGKKERDSVLVWPKYWCGRGG